MILHLAKLSECSPHRFSNGGSNCEKLEKFHYFLTPRKCLCESAFMRDNLQQISDGYVLCTFTIGESALKAHSHDVHLTNAATAESCTTEN